MGSGVILLALAVAGLALGGVLLAVLLLGISILGYLELTKVLGGLEPGDAGSAAAGGADAGTSENTGAAEGTEVGNAAPAAEGIARRMGAPEWVGICAVLLYYLMMVLCYVPRVIPLTGDLIMPDMTYVILITAAFALAELFVYVALFPKYDADRIAHCIFSFFYAPVMLSFVYMTRQIPGCEFFVWLILISSWGCDTCAYCVGVLVGKHRIFPKLSPKKTLEGCLGGIFGSALIGWAFGQFFVMRFLPEPMLALRMALVCAFGAVMGIVGDLAASGIKRNKGFKDYGKLIPGHGGIMDRFDSMIVTAPATFLLSYFLLFR